MAEAVGFDYILKDLEMFFTPLTDWQREQYFKHLGMYPKKVLDQAKDWLIGNHSYKRIPNIAEFKDAIEEVYRKISEAQPDELEVVELCEVCFGTGYHIIKGVDKNERDKARPCGNCKKGEQVKKVWKNFIRNKGRISLVTQRSPIKEGVK